MKLHTLAILMALAIAGNWAQAQNAPVKEFIRPILQNQRVDWCLHWGTECGQPAADSFCRQKGFADAANFSTGTAPTTLVMGDNQTCTTGCTGFTRINCEGSARSGANYDNWQQPSAPPPPSSGYGYSESRSVTIAVPMIDGYRVDWCVDFGAGCGKPAADQFCQRQGYVASDGFDSRQYRPTLVMGANQLCNQMDCNALVNVRCIAGGNSGSSQGYATPPPSYPPAAPSYSNPSSGYPSSRYPSSGYPMDSQRDPVKVFRYPTSRGYSIDRCLRWGVECGKPAADQFCRMNGYQGSREFTTTTKRPTLVLGDNQVCNRSDCTGFTRITCSNY